MRRLTSVTTYVLPMATALGVLIAMPASAQSTPQPTFQPMTVAPTPMPGQQTTQTTPPAAAPRAEPRAPSIASQGNLPLGPVNIRLELKLTDTISGAPVTKSVSMLVLNGHNGMIRTNNYAENAVLNVDAVASAYQNGQVSLRLTFEYVPARKDGTGRSPSLNESITVVLQEGKPMVVSQSADPSTDRKVTAELTATILK